MKIVTMIDSIHPTSRNIPVSAAQVAGYVTGTPLVKWTDSDWARFDPAHTGMIRINQDPGSIPLLGHVLDVEQGAWTNSGAVKAASERTAHHRAIAFYTSHANAAPLAQAWAGEGSLWIADWNLNLAEATALIGSKIGKMTVRAVQWASPSSNPSTRLPGSSLTLAEANCDLSTSDASWFGPGKALDVKHATLRVGTQKLAIQSSDGTTWDIV